MRQLQRILIFFRLVDISLSAKILCVFLVPFHSHQKVLRVLPEELAKQGHEIVIITPEPTRVFKENITEIDVSKVSHEKFDKVLNEVKHQKRIAVSPINLSKMVFQSCYSVSEAQINHPDVQKLINDDHIHFDLILAEESASPAVLFGAKFHVPIVLVSSCPVTPESFQHVGSETNSLLFPFNQKTPETFWDRISLSLEAIQINNLIRNSKYQDDYLIDRYFGNDAPSVEDVRKNVKMVILSVQHMWDNNRAVGPAVNYMGAIHLDKPKPYILQEDLQYYLDSSKTGVILTCFGSKAQNSNLPLHILEILLKVFASLPYNVIWKWDGEGLPYIPKNVRLQKWLPLADLLHHPKIKLLINHGGLQSTDEAIAANVPLLGLPLLGDQYHNVQKYKQYGIGTGLDIDNLNEEEFRKAILDIAGNETYRKNIRRLSRILSDQRVDGLQRAVHQIQYLLDHGFPLQSPAANISFTEYFMLDVFGPIAIVVAIVTVALGSALQRFLQSNLNTI